MIGGGKGSARAASTILGSLPIDFPAPVILALSREELGQEFSRTLKYAKGPRMTIAREGLLPAASTSYVAPVHKCIRIEADGTLGLSELTRDAADPADLALESAAAIYGKKVIGVVLSGEGHDGTRGLNQIAARGGVRIVQSPSDSRRPQMPSSAVLGDHPNYVVMVDEIAPLLVRIVQASTPRSC
ncbi:chemotaxis protein CheB [Variovorax sp. Sphag1AA]|uniref:chemotaxis protein CheB n=1 Tax=Variovorax sp. Sphag1AA TaxID=2587027 RepID=UPI0028893D16|nr:chemotaxis protein CheB [Variovorax sp. Sphag1AA]